MQSVNESKMNCPICGNNHWENVDQYRFKPEGMSICLRCGFVSYPSRWKTEEEIKAHYRKDYRSCPSANNLYSGQRKLHFHHAMLSELFEKWKIDKRGPINVFECGAAYGMALSWVRDQYSEAQVSGSELTISYRRNAFWEYGIRLEEDFDLSKKYDLIMSYKVAEHQLDIDKRLMEYRDTLKDDGFLYISVPCWFGQMNNFGLGGFDLEYYYSPNHINVWTRKLFESLLKKVGFEIVKENHVMYDSTYICKKTTPVDLVESDYESVDEIKKKLELIKLAFIAFTENRFDDAILLYPNFPQAHISRIEMSRKEIFALPWEEIEEKIIKTLFDQCDECAELWVCAADLAMRAKRWDKAIDFAEAGLRAKPHNPVNLGQLINIMREIAISSESEEKKLHYFNQARQIASHLGKVSLQNARESIDYRYLFNSQIPIPEESRQN